MYIDFLILLIPLVSALFCSSILLFVHLYIYISIYIYISYVQPFGPGWAPRKCTMCKR